MKSNERFRNRVVVVTGSSAGIGRAIACAFANEGADIALLSRNADRLRGIKQELQTRGVKAMALPLDVSDAAAVFKAAADIEQELGPIDIWINNAMVSVFSPVKEMTPEEYRRVTEVTYLGYVYGTQAALKYMLPRNRGIIIHVGSALAYRGIPLQSAYCAAKHAIQGFHDSLLCELLHDKSNVKCTMVQLSAHNTPQFDWVRSRLPNKSLPVPPIFHPEVAAEAVVWAARHYRREYVVGFPAWKGVYGNMLFPSIGDKYLAKNGYKSQQTDEPRPVDAPENLFETVDGDYGAHGRFDKIARGQDWFWLINKHFPFNYIITMVLLLIIVLAMLI